MKRIKSLLSIFLVITLALSSAAVVNAEEALGENYQKSLEMLISLKVMSGYTFEDHSNAVTRAEFAQMLCKIIFGHDGSGWSGEDTFKDVTPSDRYYASVHSLHDMKVMVGYNQEFDPNRNITYNEAITSLISLLGYSVQVSGNAAYPDEYLKIASQISLNKNVLDKSQHELNLAETAMLLYNALHIDLVTLEFVGGKAKYEQNKGVTPLSKYMNILEGSGLFSGNTISSLYGEPIYTEGYIQIDGATYRAGKETDPLLGYYVDFYYIDDDEPEVVYMRKSKKASSLEITSTEIDSFENNSYRYTLANESRSKSAKLSEGAMILYNGRIPVTLKGEALFLPKDGKVTLIDHDGDLIYDVVFIWSYETYVVKSVSTQNQFSVVDYYEKDPLILNQDEGYSVRIIKDGETADVKAITKWNVLSVATSEETGGNYLITVVVSDRRVTGIPSYDADYVIIEGEEYPLSSVFNMERKSGSLYDFYLDCLGRVAVYDPYSSDTNTVFYGFLTGFTWEENEELPPKIKIFTEEGEFVTYPLAKKVKIDGVNCKDSYELTENDNVLRNENGVVSQMIGYKLNTNKEINLIDTTEMNENENKKEAMTKTQIYASRTINYLLLGRTFGDHIALSRSLKVFKIPVDGSGKAFRGPQYEKYFEVIKGEPFTDHYDNYTVQFYNVNDAGVCNLMIHYIVLDGENDLKWQQRIAIVDKLLFELNQDDEVTVKIQGYQGKAQKVSFSVNEFALEDAMKLKKGDIIQFGTDREGKIGKIYKRYNAEEANSYYLSDATPYKATRAVYGKIVAVDYDNNAFKTCFVSNAEDELSDANSLVSNMSGWSNDPNRYDSQIMIYNLKDKSVRTADWGSVRVGQEVVIQKLETSAQSVIILE